ncbi:MAG: hypothetical protein L6R40_001303 [Gallowayella cf. fulva]|nr:MAG: hypothetical protein L6R40_001303 [Xanthomendoza cf. fulva]
MAQNSSGPLTSIDLLRMQQQGHGIISDPGYKRSFEQFSSAEPRNESVVAAPSFRKASILLSSERRPLPQEPDRLTASTISNVNDPTIKAGHETISSPHVPWKPSSSLNPFLELSHSRYGLSETLVRNFASLGIKYIYPWQSSCLLGRGLLTGEKNLVYTAPTGGGKSLVADVLMLKKVVENPHSKAILVLPYVALVQEKVNWLRRAVEGVDKDVDVSSQIPGSKRRKWQTSRSVRVVGFFGGSKSRATWADVDIAVCTFEKAFELAKERNLAIADLS